MANHIAPNPFDAFLGREITITLTRANERRIAELEDRILADDPNGTPVDEEWEDTCNILVGAMLDRGLAASEDDDHLFALFDGTIIPSPKLSLKLRIRKAWHDLDLFRRAGRFPAKHPGR